jgi:hypothetical protein
MFTRESLERPKSRLSSIPLSWSKVLGLVDRVSDSYRTVVENDRDGGQMLRSLLRGPVDDLLSNMASLEAEVINQTWRRQAQADWDICLVIGIFSE